RVGCMAEDDSESSVRKWIDKFRNILRDIAQQGQDGTNFIENVVTSFYNDDIMTFTPNGKPIVLPQKATVIDFAFEVHTDLGLHAQYARINNQLASIKTQLHRGDVVTVFDSPASHPEKDWLNHTVTYKARKNINAWLAAADKEEFNRCPICNPIPGEEVIGFRGKDGEITLHKRNCHEAIRLASQQGDSIVSVDYKESKTLYPVTVEIRAVDRYHLFIDIVDCVSNTCNLSIDSIRTDTEDSIVTCRISFGVHSYDELQRIITHITAIPGVDEVKRFTH
ncbi:MAG: TGS domain-containing protein, partial [Muribaculaceae bacterium]|nr:TGS domain-containing protein [Muribaculaceae bacterium]